MDKAGEETLMGQDVAFLAAILDSLKEPILVADADHVVRYMNRAAVDHYEGGEELIGRSLLECHNEASRRVIQETLALLRSGAEERLISEDERRKIYMRGIRGPDGRLLGYYERFEYTTNGGEKCRNDNG